MSTNSSISVLMTNGKVKSIYCHWDGYPEHMLEKLKNYNNQELAEKLVDLGDLSYLDNSLDKPENHSFDDPKKGYSIFYGRDRGETGIKAREYTNITSALKKEEQEFNYYWNGEKWGLL